MSSQRDWDLCLDHAQQAAVAGGEILQDWIERFTVSEKSRSNLVTEADFASQEKIFEMLSRHYPDDAFLGEEELETEPAESGFRWIIDPLDGTGNYVHGFPYYCVSIALEYQGEIEIGVIYDPTRRDLFTARKGHGCKLNGQQISASKIQRLEDTFCVASLPVSGDPEHPAVNRFLDLLPKTQTVQRLGSAAMNLAYLACGRIDVFWSTTLKPWDMAAGYLLVLEAGGCCSRLDRTPVDLYNDEIVACNNHDIHEQLLQHLK